MKKIRKPITYVLLVILVSIVFTACDISRDPTIGESTMTNLPMAKTGNQALSTTEVEPSEIEETAATEEVSIFAPYQMKKLLSLNDNSLEQLTSSCCEQLITVSSEDSNAKIEFYELQNNTWKLNKSLSCNGFVGQNGVTKDMHEGGYATPKGLYPIGEAFYIDDKPETGLDLFQITENTYWVDDPDSSAYNQRVEGRENADWNSAEHMIEIRPYYDYGFVIKYNTEAFYNAGSAIFFHYSNAPTAGCVGTDMDMLIRYLKVLNTDKNPYILIV